MNLLYAIREALDKSSRQSKILPITFLSYKKKLHLLPLEGLSNLGVLSSYAAMSTPSPVIMVCIQCTCPHPLKKFVFTLLWTWHLLALFEKMRPGVPLQKKNPQPYPASSHYVILSPTLSKLNLQKLLEKKYVSKMGVSKNTGIPKWMVYNGKPY